MSKTTVFTITRHLVEKEKKFPQATGEFTSLLWDLTIAFKTIASKVNQAGLIDILGRAGTENVHGEDVRKLDLIAHDLIYRAMDHGGHLCLMASEESPDVIPIPEEFNKGKYILLYDPLDGSSNIDVNVSVGTIFSILRKETKSEPGLEDCLQPGVRQIAAGYVVYGSSTMLVLTTGQGVDGFTLDPAIGEFCLSHPRIRIPSEGMIYSVNEGHYTCWDRPTRRFVDGLRNSDYTLRYIGSLVADFHRNLLTGGVFLYPEDRSDPSRPKSKLRLLYEANPLALIVEQAGGMATTGRNRILEIQPTELHQKVPLIIGSKREVEAYARSCSSERD
jgi:fructose-1,6-bisphosphatase I